MFFSNMRVKFNFLYIMATYLLRDGPNNDFEEWKLCFFRNWQIDNCIHCTQAGPLQIQKKLWSLICMNFQNLEKNIIIHTHILYLSQDAGSEPAKRLKAYQEICAHFHPVFRHFFMERYTKPDEWFERRLVYTRSVATNSVGKRIS